MLHTLSRIPRELNFIEHTSDIGWKEYATHIISPFFFFFWLIIVLKLSTKKEYYFGCNTGFKFFFFFCCCFRHQRAKPIIIDPAMYSKKKSDVYWVTEKRSVPSAYKLFTGKAFSISCFPFEFLFSQLLDSSCTFVCYISLKILAFSLT